MNKTMFPDHLHRHHQYPSPQLLAMSMPPSATANSSSTNLNLTQFLEVQKSREISLQDVLRFQSIAPAIAPPINLQQFHQIMDNGHVTLPPKQVQALTTAPSTSSSLPEPRKGTTTSAANASTFGKNGQMFLDRTTKGRTSLAVSDQLKDLKENFICSEQNTNSAKSAAITSDYLQQQQQQRSQLHSDDEGSSTSFAMERTTRPRRKSSVSSREDALPYNPTSRRSVEVSCDICGKRYKNHICLQKHSWEHHNSWHFAKRLSLTKHQSVQVMEAAHVLVNLRMNTNIPFLSDSSSSSSSLTSLNSLGVTMTADSPESEDSF